MLNMKRTWWMGLLAGVMIGAVTFTAVSGLHAQGRSSSDCCVACIDVVRIFNEYDRQKDLTEEMRVKNQEMQDEEQRRRGRIDTLQATLDAMSDDDPAKAQRQRELLRMHIDYKNWGELMQAEMAREVGVWTTRVYDKIVTATEQIAPRQGFDLVLYKEQPELIGFDPDAIRDQIRSRKLVYASDTVDITQIVLDELNDDYRAQPKRPMLQISPQMP
jgi:Skp family chaperone for outer membrane proteins